MQVENIYVINGRFLTAPLTGIGRFSLEICKALKRKNISFVLVVPRKYEGKLSNTYGLNIVYYGKYDSHIWEQISLPQYLRKRGNPLLICLSGIGPVFYKRKVITIHDLSFLVNPKWFSKSYYLLYKFLTPIAAKNSLQIFTVSEFSKSEIIKYLHTNPSKITVVYNATDFHLKQKVNSENPYGNYILGVFSLDPRKNYELLIKAFKNTDNKETKLVLVGKSFANFNNRASLNQEVDERIHFTGYVDDTELQNLYQNAKLFVYPSLYEGFGIPPLEALSFGINVLLSDIPIFKEIFGNTAYYFKNNDAGSLTEMMNKLLETESRPTPEQIQTLLEKYNWDKSAEQIIHQIKAL